MPKETPFFDDSETLTLGIDYDEIIVKKAKITLRNLLGIDASRLVYEHNFLVGESRTNRASIRGFESFLKVKSVNYSRYAKTIVRIEGFFSSQKNAIFIIQLDDVLSKTIVDMPIQSDLFDGINFTYSGARETIQDQTNLVLAQKVHVWKDSDTDLNIVERYFFHKSVSDEVRALLMCLLRIFSGEHFELYI
jgi:hypothetical protein